MTAIIKGMDAPIGCAPCIGSILSRLGQAAAKTKESEE